MADFREDPIQIQKQEKDRTEELYIERRRKYQEEAQRECIKTGWIIKGRFQTSYKSLQGRKRRDDI
jgi:hypothetical protein